MFEKTLDAGPGGRGSRSHAPTTSSPPCATRAPREQETTSASACSSSRNTSAQDPRRPPAPLEALNPAEAAA